MSCSPQACGIRRGPRFRLTDTTPAFLQFQNGRCVTGELHVISLTGGLLMLPEPMARGSMVELVFETHQGPVLGRAEMLTPVTSSQQPFRFIALPEGGQHKLQAAFQSRLYRNTDAEERIEELRAAVANAVKNWNPFPWWRHFSAKLAIGVVALLGCLAWAIYVRLFAR